MLSVLADTEEQAAERQAAERQAAERQAETVGRLNFLRMIRHFSTYSHLSTQCG
jgi:hypothetical protein